MRAHVEMARDKEERRRMAQERQLRHWRSSVTVTYTLLQGGDGEEETETGRGQEEGEE